MSMMDSFFKPSSNVNVQEEHMERARMVQNLHFELLNGSSFDVLPKKDFDKFEVILGNFFPKNVAKNISAKFSKRTEDFTFRVLLVICCSKDSFAVAPVIRVLENSRAVIYDSQCRKYSTWNDYLYSNKLPKSVMIFPENGHYKKEKGELNLTVQNSPATSLASQTDEHLYTIAKVVGVISTIAPLFSFVQPYSTLIKYASGISESYIACHHGYQLYDRACHGQDIGFDNDAAFQHWSHIGNAFFSFALTYWRLECCQPSGENDMSNFLNIISLCHKELYNNDPIEGMNLIKGHILCQHMLCFSNEAVSLLHKLHSRINIPEVMVALRKFLSTKGSSVLRKLIYVEVDKLERVAKDIKSCQEINHLKCDLYNNLKEKVTIVEHILKEVQDWENGKISDIQLQFRMKEIFRGGKKYETVSEMLKYFKVGRIEDIQIKGKFIFCDIGSGKFKFESLIENSIKRYPQLLPYAVDYAEASVEKIDWGGFKAYFKDRLLKEVCNASSLILTHDISWYNALNSQEVRFLTDMPENVIDLVKPKELQNSICAHDLVNLGKKVMGSCYISIKLANSDIDWAILISKPLKKCVLIGPQIILANNSMNGSYPVFVRNFS